jgi:UDP-N-acetylmuramate--alanine ligase
MKLSTYRNIYFLGIGGIGMSALARWFKANGFYVGGYDKTSSPLTEALEAEGMDIHYDDKVGRIPTQFYNKEETLVVITPAIPVNNIELIHFTGEQFTMMKRAQVLGLLTADMTTVAIAGTHGKTTTSSMTAHILKHSGLEISAFLGGITANYNSNLLIGDKEGIAVVEADEYDRSFLTLYPSIAVVTSTDADHLDIYGDHNSLLDSFNAFVGQIKKGGKLVIKKGLTLNVPDHVSKVNYGIGDGEIFAMNVRPGDACFTFDYVSSHLIIRDITLNMPGFHNVENAVAAMTVAKHLRVPMDKIKAGVESFKGVKRRFEFIYKSEKTVYIDDYAHHPTEIEACLLSVKALYPTKKISVIFQPHLFSRTRDFAEGFAQSLSLADQLFLLDIYPARELPIPGVSSEMLMNNITSKEKQLCTKENLMNLVQNNEFEVLVTIGAGDIDRFVPQIKEVFSKR